MTQKETLESLLVEWRKTDWSDKPEGVIIDALCRMTPWFMARNKEYKNLKLYRIRRNLPNSEMFSTLQDALWPPHAPAGRVNRAGVPLLYTSNSVETAVEEMHLEIGDRFTVFEFRSNAHDPLNFCDFLYKVGSLPLKADQKTTLRLIQALLRNEFQRVVTKQDIWHYKITECIASTYLDMPHVDGYCYPSVANFGSGLNFAIRPESVDRAVRLKRATVTELIGYKDDLPVLRQIDTASVCGSNLIFMGAGN